MNEVTKVHLGRQAFAISAEAHRDLQHYLNTIRKYVSEESVITEIELRMAELLNEHGVSGEKVVLPADVSFLKEQLGDPKDFADEAEPEPATDKPADSPKRLFRDTDNAMLAGVAAGLANYFGVDVLIIRLLFVIATFTGGWGILIYIVLWLLVPEAKTPSDRLQMAGKSVNIDSLREVVERADVKGAAQRANKSLAGPVNKAFRVILQIIGVCLVALGLALLLSLIAGGSYLSLHSGNIIQDGIFPVGLKEHLVVYIAAGVGAVISIFIVLFGMALFRRKWPIHTWITGMLVGLLFAGLAVGGALSADVAPQIRDRYNSHIHTVVYTVQPFTEVNLDNAAGDIRYQWSPKYSVSVQYWGNSNISTVKTSVKNGVLYIDTSRLDHSHDSGCRDACIPINYDPTVIIYSPETPAATYPDLQSTPALPSPTPPSILKLKG